MDRDLPLVPLLQRQLETTLQLLISASSAMTPDDIIFIRIRLNEANLLLREILIERDNNAANGNLLPTLCRALTHFLIEDAPNHSPVDNTPATPRNVNATGSSSSQNHTGRSAVGRSTSRRTVRRPATRSTTRVGAVIGALPRFRLAGNALVPLIEMATDSDED